MKFQTLESAEARAGTQRYGVKIDRLISRNRNFSMADKTQESIVNPYTSLNISLEKSGYQGLNSHRMSSLPSLPTLSLPAAKSSLTASPLKSLSSRAYSQSMLANYKVEGSSASTNKVVKHLKLLEFIRDRNHTEYEDENTH